MPDNPNVLLLEASLRAAQGKPDVARSILLKARDSFGDRRETWLALSEFLISQGEFTEAPRLSTRPENESATDRNFSSRKCSAPRGCRERKV